MDLLNRAASRFTDKQIFWILHGSDPAKLSDNGRRLLATSRNSALLIGQDADTFFLRLLRALGIGAPESIREPLFLVSLNASRLSGHDPKDVLDGSIITAEIDRHRREIEAMTAALDRRRKSNTQTEEALSKARELRLAGKTTEAMNVLQSASKRSKDVLVWEEFATVADEVADMSPDRGPQETAIAAWRRVLKLME
jgi:hypothetical protein